MKKFLLFKTIFISSLVTTSTICITSSSCAADVQVQYFLDGGSLSLQGKTSTAGQDEGVWKLYSESQEIKSEITWKLTSATAEELPDSIKINDGVVSWTDQIEAGTYQFYVVATYNDKEVKTNEINLVIHTYVLKNDLEETVLYYDKSSYEEPKCLKNWYLYDEIDQMPIPSFKCQYRLETYGYSSVFSIDEYGFLSWNENIASKNFNFQVICLYENVEVCSEIYTLSVVDTSIFSYVLNDDNYSYTIFSHESFNYGEFDVLNLPSKYLNLPINKIGDNFLSGCSSFNPTEFIIPNNLQTIGDNFLSGCSSFNPTKFDILPNNLQTIGDNFLSSCSSFNPTEFIIPNNLQTIGNNFLSDCSAFNPTEFIIPNSLRMIGNNFLSDCSAFNSTFFIPQYVWTIGDNFLSGCSSFNPTEFTITETILHIGGGLFYNCYSINCLKVMCSIDSLQSSQLSFSVDDMTRDVFKNGLQVFVKTKIDFNDFVSTFGDINDVENKIFRHLNTRVIT